MFFIQLSGRYHEAIPGDGVIYDFFNNMIKSIFKDDVCLLTWRTLEGNPFCYLCTKQNRISQTTFFVITKKVNGKLYIVKGVKLIIILNHGISFRYEYGNVAFLKKDKEVYMSEKIL